MSELAFFDAMQHAMDDQAVDVWNMVRHSRAAGYRLRLGEVTVTELNFYRLRDFWTKSVYIDTNEPNETATGADWEWLIGHDDNWVQIRVQAKIVNEKGSFAELGHPSRSGEQMNRLIDPVSQAVLCRWIPLYVFYSAQPPVSLSKLTIGPHDERLGCSAKLARDVRDTYGPHSKRATLAAKAHLPGSIAWSRIFKGLVTRLAAGQALGSIVDALADQALPDDLNSIDQFWDSSVTAGYCGKDLPEYVKAIIAHQDDEFDRAPLARLEILHPLDEAGTSQIGRDNPVSAEALEGEEPRHARGENIPQLDEESLPKLPSRMLLLDRSSFEQTFPSLPSFVSVINIDQLPLIEGGYSAQDGNTKFDS